MAQLEICVMPEVVFQSFQRLRFNLSKVSKISITKNEMIEGDATV